MLRLALSRGHGSTIWVTASVAIALPPDRAIVSRRSIYSEHPPSTAKKAPSATLRRALLNGRIGFPLRQIEHVSGKRPVAGDSNACCAWRELARLFARDFGLS